MRIACFCLISLVACSAAVGSVGRVVTNAALLRELEAWSAALTNGRHRQVVAAVDSRMSDVTLLTAPVLQGSNWVYQWGFPAHCLKGAALLALDDAPGAYRELADASAYMPSSAPPGDLADDYWAWWGLMGEVHCCLGRFQDAAYYFETLARGVSTNTAALDALAFARLTQGRYEEAISAFDRFFARDPGAGSEEWNVYAGLLMEMGRYEEGVTALLEAANRLGEDASPDEYFSVFRSGRRYWYHFTELDVRCWYDALGGCLERAQLVRANEKTFALMITTRRLMRKVYPRLFPESADDLADLKRRAKGQCRPGKETTRRFLASEGRGPAVRDVSGADKRRAAHAERGMATRTLRTGVEADIEDAVNALLARQMRGHGGNSKVTPREWEALVERFGTNALASVWIDGITARALVYIESGHALRDCGRHEDARASYELAEGLTESYGNALRVALMLTSHSLLCLKGAGGDTNEALRLLEWARGIAEGNVPLSVSIVTRMAQLNCDEDPDIAARQLREMIETYGDCLPMQTYKQLATYYYAHRMCAKAFETLVTGVKRSDFTWPKGLFRLMTDTAAVQRDILTIEELEMFRNAVKAAVLRVPAMPGRLEKHDRFLDMTNPTWLEGELQLAAIEQRHEFTDDDWLIITNYLCVTPGARAGRLHLEAQLLREPGETAALDWSGWLAGWRAIGGLHGRYSGSFPRAYEAAIGQENRVRFLRLALAGIDRMSSADKAEILKCLRPYADKWHASGGEIGRLLEEIMRELGD